MQNLIPGCLGFIFFILYDVNHITKKSPLLLTLFPLGCLCLIYSTLLVAFSKGEVFFVPDSAKYPFGFFTLAMLALLVYTLFFALPFKKTYFSTEGAVKVYDQGVYALCRHPGVLWLIGFYVFGSVYLGNVQMLQAGMIYGFLDIFYVWLQDRYIFPKQFSDYSAYQASTPFLIPNFKSLRRSAAALKSR